MNSGSARLSGAEDAREPVELRGIPKSRNALWVISRGCVAWLDRGSAVRLPGRGLSTALERPAKIELRQLSPSSSLNRPWPRTVRCFARLFPKSDWSGPDAGSGFCNRRQSWAKARLFHRRAMNTPAAFLNHCASSFRFSRILPPVRGTEADGCTFKNGAAARFQELEVRPPLIAHPREREGQHCGQASGSGRSWPRDAGILRESAQRGSPMRLQPEGPL